MNKYIRTLFFLVISLVSIEKGVYAKSIENEDFRGMKQYADSLYTANLYEQAREKYIEAIDFAKKNDYGVSATLYYNLANCYYRLDSIGKSILFYEKAYVLEPNNTDIEHNLAFAQKKSKDKILLIPEFFLMKWFNSISAYFHYETSAFVALVSFIVFLLSLLCYLFVKKDLVRKISSYVAFLSIISCLLFNLFAYQRYSAVNSKDKAILVESAVSVKSTPDHSGNSLFVINEGTKIILTGNKIGSWYEIKLSDGRSGWIEISTFEII